MRHHNHEARVIRVVDDKGSRYQVVCWCGYGPVAKTKKKAWREFVCRCRRDAIAEDAEGAFDYQAAAMNWD